MKESLLESLPTISQHEISQCLHAGQKIQAIKLYRDVTGCDLLAAKLAVEQIEKDLKAQNPYAFLNKTPPVNTGSQVIIVILLLAVVLSGLAFFIASSLEEKPLFSTSRLEKLFNDLTGSDRPEPKTTAPETPASAIPKPESRPAPVVAAKKKPDVKAKAKLSLDTSPYQPLTETISTDLHSLYLEKLANPAYQIWMSQPGPPRGYQDYREEHRIKAKRAALASQLTAPPQQPVFTIPKLTHAAIDLDGHITKEEWQNALVIPFTPEKTGSILYLQRDADWLYLAADVPQDLTATGFDQFRFYIHVDLDPTLRNERIHVNYEKEQILGGIRETTVKWPGSVNQNENERWKTQPISDWQIYRLARGAAGLNPHRQYEARLSLKEIGLSVAAPFPAFAEIETDPVYENGRFKNRVYLGELGSQEKPLWFRME